MLKSLLVVAVVEAKIVFYFTHDLVLVVSCM